MKKYDVIIIGCGAAGSMCALNIHGKKVAIIDSATKPAKKLLVTGNGRCNLTNINMKSCYFNQNIDKYLDKFEVEKTLKYFEDLGLETYSDDEGRVYPLSNSAKSVVDCITAKLSQKADLFMEQKVQKIQKTKSGYEVITDKDTFVCNKLVVSTGGASENILKDLDIEYKPFAPSLVALKCDNIKDLNGVKVSNVNVSVVTASGKTHAERGEVLFKDGGVSGIVIFNLSALFARDNNYNGELTIDLLPDITENDLVAKLKTRKKLNVVLDKFFVGFFNNALANEILKQAKINTNINSQNLTDEHISKLAQTIKGLQYNVCGYFDNNQVFSGGVKLADLTETFESNICPNLYFVGEICDIDGVCGGYNLQWAFTSGKIVGDSL